MKKITILSLLTLFFAVSAFADLSTNITLNGTLSEKPADANSASNKPIDNQSLNIHARLYISETDLIPVWEETQDTTIQNGSFSFSVSNIPEDIFLLNSELYLGISVEDDEEMKPRIPFNRVPYAVTATHATNADHALVADALSSQAVLPTGPKGDVGPQGPQGPKGDAGNTGPQGAMGPMGSQGVAGPTGSVGPEGPQGPAGSIGPEGPQGPVGPKGDTGSQGPVGATGTVGPQGAQGPMGLTGPIGLTGPMGPQGLPGLTGPEGPQGSTGEQGAIGPQGIQGPQGLAGPAGPSSFDTSYYRRAGVAVPEVWYSSEVTGNAITTGTPAAAKLIAIPFIVSKDVNLDRIAITVTNAKNGNTRLGIYEDDGNLYPGALVLDAGVVATNTTGIKSINISQSLAGNNLYWLVAVASTNATIRCLNPANVISILGFANTLAANPALGYIANFAYNPLPTDFPANEALLNAAPVPAIFVRIQN